MEKKKLHQKSAPSIQADPSQSIVSGRWRAIGNGASDNCRKVAARWRTWAEVEKLENDRERKTNLKRAVVLFQPKTFCSPDEDHTDEEMTDSKHW